ncbi:MAG: hypothetical protein NTY37_06105 [Methanothrix sp.]|nr:hypothetical protein [Methanothrix sp.]
MIPWISGEAAKGVKKATMIADLKHYSVMKFFGVPLQLHLP